MKKLIVIIMLMACLLFGCAKQITEGTIVDRNFKKAYTEVTQVPQYGANGQVTHYTTQTTHHPDKWTIVIEGQRSKDGKIVKETYKVSEKEYNKLEKGDYWEAPEEE